MKRINFKLKFYFLFTLFFVIQSASVNLYPQNIIEQGKTLTGTLIVTGGRTLTSPVKTTYGYIILTEGNFLNAFSNDGKLLWTTSYRKKLTKNISVGKNDFIYAVTKDSSLSLLNPDGILQWSVKTEGAVIEKPLAGRDGRVFARGKNFVSCYDLNGRRKWKIKTKTQNAKIEMQELNDGSLLLFNEELKEGKTSATRVSPYGKEYEEITFAGFIKQAFSTVDGVALCFSDGSLGMCSVKNEKTYSSFVINSSKLAEDTKILEIADDRKKIIVSTQGGKYISIINSSSGYTLVTLYLGSKLEGGVTYAQMHNDFILLSNLQHAFVYTVYGELIARLDYKAKNKIDYVLFTATNSLAVLNANWNIEFYKVFSGTKKANAGNKDFLKQFVPATYKEFLGRGNNYLSSSQALEKAIPQNLYEKILQDFTTGDYDEKEIEYIQRINAELEDILAEYSVSDWNYTTKNLAFAKDRNYELQIISLMTKTGTIDFTQKLSTLLKKENDLTMLRNFISLISNVKFDYNETLVNALDHIVRVKLKNDDVTSHKLVCDALYDLSSFMGQKYFLKNVTAILTQMLYPQYDEQIKAYARETLLKISSP